MNKSDIFPHTLGQQISDNLDKCLWVPVGAPGGGPRGKPLIGALLHSIFGIDHVNILTGPSNGLELLNFFAEALQEQDIFGNPLLKQGDLVIMDNCGFHHAHHVEPVLRNMLGLRGVYCLSTSLPSSVQYM